MATSYFGSLLSLSLARKAKRMEHRIVGRVTKTSSLGKNRPLKVNDWQNPQALFPRQGAISFYYFFFFSRDMTPMNKAMINIKIKKTSLDLYLPCIGAIILIITIILSLLSRLFLHTHSLCHLFLDSLDLFALHFKLPAVREINVQIYIFYSCIRTLNSFCRPTALKYCH